MVKNIYISGKISNTDIEETLKLFDNIQQQLLDRGYCSFNPLRNGLSWNEPRRNHLKVDLRNLLRCDAILMISNWRDSEGAKLEHEIAKQCDIPIYYNIHELENYNC